MIGARLRMLRKEQGITQSQLAQALSVTKFTISAYENGRSEPDDEIKLRIARLLNVSLDYLLGLIDYPYPLEGRTDVVPIPEGLTAEQRQLVIDFLHFLEHKNQQPGKAL